MTDDADGSRRRPTCWLACLLVVSLLTGCGLLKKKVADDDSARAIVDAATVAPAGLGAKNEANVLRYAVERALDQAPAVIAEGGAKARNSPGRGPEVATLAKGTPVVKLAQYFDTAVLVMFDDPAGDGSKLMGWVPLQAFDAPAAGPTVAPARTAPPPRLDAGQVIAGDAGTREPVDAGATKSHDAGASVPSDAGTSAKDAGGAAWDAGSALAAPPKGALAVPPVDDRCPLGWTVAEGMCRRMCGVDSDCPRNTHCVIKQRVKVCTSDR